MNQSTGTVPNATDVGGSGDTSNMRSTAAPSPRPEWLETIPNDGTHEYTMSADCDGENPRYWRRAPRYVTPAGEFTEVTAEQYTAATEAHR